MRRRIAKGILLAVLIVVAAVRMAAAAPGEGTPNASTGDPGIKVDKGLQAVVDFAVRIVRFISAFAGIVLAGAIIFNAYRLMVSVNPAVKAQASSSILTCLIAGVIVFGVWVIIGIVKGLAESI